MAEEARERFVDAYRQRDRRIVGFAVLGGLFTESIDLPADALTGIAVVGLGLPPPTLERNEMAECFGEPFGRALAYEQPAMTRVVQAAGRLIRRESDRGVVCLIDGRFLASEYREYMPRHWRPVRATQPATCRSARRVLELGGRTRIASYGNSALHNIRIETRINSAPNARRKGSGCNPCASRTPMGAKTTVVQTIATRPGMYT